MTASWFTSFIPMFSAAIWYTVYNNNEEKVISGIKNIPTWTKETIREINQRRADRQELRIQKLSKEDQ